MALLREINGFHKLLIRPYFFGRGWYNNYITIIGEMVGRPEIGMVALKNNQPSR